MFNNNKLVTGDKMKSIRHWTPRYIFNRVNYMVYQKIYPGYPWLTQAANSILESLLKKSDIGLEFGSGMSTIWFAQRISFLTSVENNEFWYKKVKLMLDNKKIYNVDYILFHNDANNLMATQSQYIEIINKFPRHSLDFVLVDSADHRAACANKVIEKIKPGGLLVLDNANWYLPCNSYSPNSRTWADGPLSLEWVEFLAAVQNWRFIWTTSGVTDTAFFLKSCD
jgi:hypothetical protein